MRRPLLALATVLALAGAVPLAGCASKEKTVTHGETEGSYLDLDGLKYQVQISRELNPADNEDKDYLRGIAPAVAKLAPGEEWFAVFVRVENGHDRNIRATSPNSFEISDTQDNVYHPVAINPSSNDFAYDGGSVPGHGQIPLYGTPAFNSPSVGGALVLFKIKNASFDNRPLVLSIGGTSLPQTDVTVDLDV